MTHNTREVEIRDILIELTDTTGFDHTPEALFAFERAKEKLHHQLQKAREEALAREKQLKQVHMMELDAISCKSIEDFVLWRDHRKQRPKHSELNQDKKYAMGVDFAKSDHSEPDQDNALHQCPDHYIAGHSAGINMHSCTAELDQDNT